MRRFAPGGQYERIPLTHTRLVNFVTAEHYQQHPAVVHALEWKVVYEMEDLRSVRVVRLKGDGSTETKVLDVSAHTTATS